MPYVLNSMNKQTKDMTTSERIACADRALEKYGIKTVKMESVRVKVLWNSREHEFHRFTASITGRSNNPAYNHIAAARVGYRRVFTGQR